MIGEQATSYRFEDAMPGFERYLRATGGSKGKVGTEVSIRTYTQQIKLFWDFCRRYEVTPYDASVGICERWFDFRKRGELDDLGRRYGKVSSSTRTKDLYALRHWYAYLQRDGYRDDDPTEAVKVKKETSVATKPQTEGELGLLIGECKTERDKLIVLVLGATGMRVGEMEAMRTWDLDWDTGAMTLHGKGSKERRAYLPLELLKRLRLFVGLLDRDNRAVREGVIWQTRRRPYCPLKAKEIGRMLKETGERAGVDEVHPHRLRSMFAVEYLREHHDLKKLAQLMGHADVNTTMQYLKWITDEEALQDQRTLPISQRLISAAWEAEELAAPCKPAGLVARLGGLFRRS